MLSENPVLSLTVECDNCWDGLEDLHDRVRTSCKAHGQMGRSDEHLWIEGWPMLWGLNIFTGAERPFCSNVYVPWSLMRLWQHWQHVRALRSVSFLYYPFPIYQFCNPKQLTKDPRPQHRSVLPSPSLSRPPYPFFITSGPWLCFQIPIQNQVPPLTVFLALTWSCISKKNHNCRCQRKFGF